MSMRQLVERLALADADKRRIQLLNVLTEKNIPFDIEELSLGTYQPKNIRVRLTNADNRIIMGAHYDAVPNSIGANDNAVGVAILIEFIQLVRSQKRDLPNLEFVFFDLEELEMKGSLAYVDHHDTSKIKAMINIDLCGVGDTILVAEGNRKQHDVLHTRLLQIVAESPHIQSVSSLPPSDDMYFEGMNIPTFSVCCVPHEDVSAMQGLAIAMHSGKPPKKMPSVFEAMHNRYQDTIDVIEEQAMQNVLNLLQSLLVR